MVNDTYVELHRVCNYVQIVSNSFHKGNAIKCLDDKLKKYIVIQ